MFTYATKRSGFASLYVDDKEDLPVKKKKKNRTNQN